MGKICELRKDCDLKNNTPAGLTVSKFITSKTNIKYRDKKQYEKNITVKLVVERIRQDTHQTHVIYFIQNNEIEQEKTMHETEEWNRQKKNLKKTLVFYETQRWTPEHYSSASLRNC